MSSDSEDKRLKTLYVTQSSRKRRRRTSSRRRRRNIVLGVLGVLGAVGLVAVFSDRIGHQIMRFISPTPKAAMVRDVTAPVGDSARKASRAASSPATPATPPPKAATSKP